MNNNTKSHKILRYVLTAVGLAISGIIFGVLGALAGRELGDGSLAALGLAIIGLILGYLFGIVAGLLAIRFLLKQRGSVIFGIVCAIAWVGLTIAISIPLNMSDALVNIFIIFSLVCVPVAALLGFYLKK